jgi:hypothetical protein
MICISLVRLEELQIRRARAEQYRDCKTDLSSREILSKAVSRAFRASSLVTGSKQRLRLKTTLSPYKQETVELEAYLARMEQSFASCWDVYRQATVQA